MKAAIIIGGLPKAWWYQVPAIPEMMNGVPADIYIYSWDDFTEGYSAEEGLRVLSEEYQPFKIKVESFSTIEPELARRAEELAQYQPPNEKRKKKYSLKTGLLAQYYTIRKAWELIDNPDEYDVVIRMRFDWTPRFKFDWGELYEWTRDHICYCNRSRQGLKAEGLALSDFFMVSNPKIMSVYTSLFQKMMHTDDYIPVVLEKKCFIPEFILAYHFEVNEIKRRPSYFPYELRHRPNIIHTPQGKRILKESQYIRRKDEH